MVGIIRERSPRFKIFRFEDGEMDTMLAFVNGTLDLDEFLIHEEAIMHYIKHVRSKEIQAYLWELLDKFRFDAEEALERGYIS